MATERERGKKRTQINCVSTWDQTKSVYTLSFTVHCNFFFPMILHVLAVYFAVQEMEFL